MKSLFKILFVLTLSMQIHSQEKLITGVVTSTSDNSPIPGVNITVKGETKGTVTNFDGKYQIKAKEKDILIFAYLGFVTQEVEVDKSTSISVQLVESLETLDEVVVIGYGTQKRKSITGSVTHVRSESINKSIKSDLNRALQGKVSGVTIVNNSGNPNNSSSIVIGGINSINTANEPLYVVDGIPVSSSEMKTINPNHIKDVDVLKDVASTAIYGTRAANGAILINTKKGNYKPSNVHEEELNQDAYKEIVENVFERTALSPLSTFSIDVDKASYSNIRRMINNGTKIQPDAVKIEEMINYFSYSYPQPMDEHPFSINTEVAKTPWNSDTKIVKIGLQGKTYDNSDLPTSNLTFLIDVSGSMNSTNKLPLLKSAFKLLVNQLRDQDKVSIVVYAGAAGVVLEPTSGNKKEKIMAALNNLEAGGSTAGGAGIELAYKLAEKHFKKNGNNRVILATDGDFNVGASSDKDMKDLIEEKRKSGVFLSVLGFGYGNYKDSKLETLADKGNGNHAYIDNMQEAQKVFGKEFGGTLYTIAKDVKIQVEFNPTKVQAYRLIGYENRMLEDEDFIDDTKDAGELGSGHAVTALYEVIPFGIKSDYLKDVSFLKYTKSEIGQNYSDELFTVKFRYKNPDGHKSIEMVHIQKDVLSEASEDLKFATAIALFGMQLRQSKYHNNSKTEDVIELAQAGKGADSYGYKSEFIRLVKIYN